MGDRIQVLRKEKKLSQNKLAIICKCNQSTIANIERGKRMPSIELAEKIANALDTTIDYLLKG